MRISNLCSSTITAWEAVTFIELATATLLSETDALDSQSHYAFPLVKRKLAKAAHVQLVRCAIEMHKY